MNLEFESAGALVTATLAANEIEHEGVGSGPAAHGDCANCHTPLTGSFCHACGQRAHVHRSLLHFGEEFLHGLLHFDAKAWRTLPMLVAKPGKLTREYIDGKRTRYVSPLALFLFMVFFMFFVVSSISHKSAEEPADAVAAATADFKEDIANAKSRLERAQATLNAARASGKGVSAAEADAENASSRLKKREDALRLVMAGAGKAAAAASTEKAGDDDFNVDTGMPSVDAAIRHAAKNPEFTLYKLKNAASKFSFLLVPISLPFLWLMFFWKRGVTMYDHAVFALYSLSYMALLVVVLSLLKLAGLKPLVVAMVFIAPPLHMFMQLRGAYSLGFGSALWRTLVLMCVSATVFVIYLLLILMMSMAG